MKLQDLLDEKSKGLWANIHAKRKSGRKPAKKGSKQYKKTAAAVRKLQRNEVDYHSKNSPGHKPDWSELHADEEIVREASRGAFGDGEPETGYLPKGKVRKLGTRQGKPEKWFDQGGYVQLDFPEADDIYGKGNKPDLQSKKTTTPTSDTLKLKEIIEEGKKLTVFDFDDTLAKTDSWVYVMKNGKRVAQLDPGEFAVHKLGPDQEYDFSDFDKVLRNPKLIKKNAIEFRKQSDHARRTPGHQVTILTARGIGFPVKHWFKKMGMDVYVVALKSADPKKKADYIEKKIQGGYTDIYFIDDSPKNVRAVKALQVKYPKVKIKTVQA